MSEQNPKYEVVIETWVDKAEETYSHDIYSFPPEIWEQIAVEAAQENQSSE